MILLSNLFNLFSQSVDHMHIEEYIEEDEEPPLLLSSHPPCGKYIDMFAVCVHMCSLLTLVCVPPQVFGCGGTAAVQCQWGEGCGCLQCHAGQEPSEVRQEKLI